LTQVDIFRFESLLVISTIFPKEKVRRKAISSRPGCYHEQNNTYYSCSL